MSEKKGGDLWLRVIIVFKVVKAIGLIALGITAFALANKDIYWDAAKLVTWLGLDAGRPTVGHALTDLIGISPDRVVLIGAGAIAYALVFAVEAYGLHRRTKWGEWLTVGVTSSLIPFEVYELVEHMSVGKVIALVLNIAIVIYLMVRRLHQR